MKVVIAVEGSTGDVQPTLSFCKFLARQGHDAVLCSSCTRFHVRNDGEVALERGPQPELPEAFRFVRLPIWEAAPFQEAMSAVSASDQEAQFTGYGKWFGSMCLGSCTTVAEVVRAQRADVFLSNNGCLAYVIHEACNLPVGKLILQPQMATRDFPAMNHPTWTKLDVPVGERLVSARGLVAPADDFHDTYVKLNERVQASMRPYVEQARANLMSAPPPLPEDAGIWAWLDGPCSGSPAPRFALNTFSPCFFAKGFGYGPDAPLVGPWMDSEEECLDGQLPEGLASFLESCERPPAYVGFGSMSINGAAAWTKLAVAALHALDPERKHIVGSGWAGLCLGALDAADPQGRTLREWAAQHVFFIEGHVPHAWLLPRCGMAVHHGGAGTTQAAARAGLPQVVVPLLADQPLWGLALEEYGAGVRVQKFLADPSLTAGELCAAMQRADSADLKAAARQLRVGMLSHGDGRENAMRFLQSMVACQTEP